MTTPFSNAAFDSPQPDGQGTLSQHLQALAAASTGAFAGTMSAGGITPISDPTMLVQISAGTNTQAYYGINKGTGYGLILGYNTNSSFLSGPSGLIRMVTADPLKVVTNNSVQASQWDSSGYFRMNLGAVVAGGFNTDTLGASGAATFGKTLAVSQTIGYSGAPVATVSSQSSVSGTASGNAWVNAITSPSDTVAAIGATSGTLYLLNVTQNSGGSAMTGNRVGVSGAFNLTSTSGNVTNPSGGGSYVAGQFTAQGLVNDNGTSSVPKGLLYGLNSVAALTSASATYWNQLIGYELDVYAVAGSSAQDKIGLSLVQIATDAAQGSRDDVAIAINNQAGAVGWNYGLTFGRLGGSWPIVSGGTLIGAMHGVSSSAQAAHGVDFSGVTFSADAFKSTGFKVDGSGFVFPNLLNAASDSAAATAGVPVGALYRNGNAVQVRLS